VIGANANFGNHDIELRQGNNSLTIGPGLQARDIKAEDGADTIDIGDCADIRNIDVGDGNNEITLGNNVVLNDLRTGNGNNKIMIRNGLSMDNLTTGNGVDTIVIGDGATINDLDTNQFNDTILLGDSFLINKIEAGAGDDFVQLGDFGTIEDKVDGQGGNDKLSNGNDYVQFADNFEEIVCFAAGTLIATPCGERPVETLAVGDLVSTLDDGPQAIRWIGTRTLSARVLVECPNLRPIRISAGAIGDGQPASDLVVSPQHRILIRSRIPMRMFGAPEVLAAAKQFLALPGFEIAEDLDTVQYVHFLCDRHEIVRSNGAYTETLYLGPQAQKSLQGDVMGEIRALFPRLTGKVAMPGSRYLVPGRKARALAERHLEKSRRLLLPMAN